MNRFIKVLILLIVGLLLLATGVDATLDRLTQSAKENTYTLYAENGDTLVAYRGDLTLCASYTKPEGVLPRHSIHRLKITNS